MAPLESSFTRDASWSTLEQWFCAQIPYPQIKLCSVWKAHEANKQTADQFWLPHHWQGTNTSPKSQIITFYLMLVHREGEVAGEIFLSERLQLLSSTLKQFFPKQYYPGPYSLFCLFQCFQVLFCDEFYCIFPNPLIQHLQCFCPPTWLVFCLYLKINSYNRSSCNKQIFALALHFHKLTCSSSTLKWKYYTNPSCCSHSQMTRKSVKMLNLRHPGSPSQHR